MIYGIQQRIVRIFDAKIVNPFSVLSLFFFVSLFAILLRIFGFKILNNRETISEHAVHTKSL